MAGKMTFVYATNLANALFGYVFVIVALSFVGIDQFGVFAFCLSLAGMLYFLTDLGLSRAHVKSVSEGRDFATCMTVFLVLKSLLVAAYLVSIFIMLVLLDVWNIDYTGNSEMGLVIFVVALYYSQIAIASVFSSTFIAVRMVGRAQLILIADSVSRVLLVVAMLVLGGGLSELAYATALSGTISMVVGFYLYLKAFGRLSRSHYTRAMRADYVRFARPLALATTIGYVVLYVDKVIIQMTCSSTDTAIYYGIQRLLIVYTMLSSAVIALAFPQISELNAVGLRRDDIRAVVASSFRFLSVLSIPLTVFIAFNSSLILSVLFSDDFAPGSAALSILAVAYCINALTAPFSSHTLGIGRSALYAKHIIAYFPVALGLYILLIPEEVFGFTLGGLGTSGAAIGALVAQSVVFTLFYTTANRTLGLSVLRGVLTVISLSAVAMLAIVIVLGLFDMSSFARLLIGFSSFLSLVLVLLLGFGIITKSEILSSIRGMFGAS